jgi:predicted Rossmann fold nucleotide-binding protein DprA/Smf involved in DNA uptake
MGQGDQDGAGSEDLIGKNTRGALRKIRQERLEMARKLRAELLQQGEKRRNEVKNLLSELQAKRAIVARRRMVGEAAQGVPQVTVKEQPSTEVIQRHLELETRKQPQETTVVTAQQSGRELQEGLKAKVLQTLATAPPGGLTIGEVKKETGAPLQELGKMLKELREEGKIWKKDKRYALSVKREQERGEH